MLCTKTGKGCCDDLCHGSGCLEMDGYAMLAECDVCGGIVDEEIPECSTCTCGDDDDDYDWCEDCGNQWEHCKCSLNYPKAAQPNAELRGRPLADGPA